jgi:hypothetical protein
MGSRRPRAACCAGMGPEIQWVQSYVTDDRIYCVYIAPNAEAVLEHAQKPASQPTESPR